MYKLQTNFNQKKQKRPRLITNSFLNNCDSQKIYFTFDNNYSILLTNSIKVNVKKC